MNALLIVTLIALGAALGYLTGWNACTNATDTRYVRALAEQHEATKRYWDIHTNNILANNTLRRKQQ